MDQIDLDHAITRLRAQRTDDAFIEVKSSQSQLGKAVWESISAFANTTGGYLLLGVDEKKNFTPVVDFQLDKVQDSLIDGLSNPSNLRVTPPPSFETFRLTVDGKAVLVIAIKELSLQNKPCYVTDRGLENGSYKRVDDKDIKLSTTEIFELRNALIPQTTDKTSVPEATGLDLDPAKISRFIDYLEAANSRALRGTTDLEARQTRLNILSSQGVPTFAALLVFGNYPQQFFPKLNVDVTVHQGTEKALPSSSVRFIDRKICDGTVSEMLEEALLAVQRNLRTYSIVEGIGRQDQLEIPLEVLREGIANAIVHREYAAHFLGTPVSVDVYSDRIEITSPGGLWGGKTKDNLDDGHSAARNQLLIQLLSLAPSSENLGITVEGQGSGIPLMKNQMRSRSLELPQFRVNPDRIILTLQRHGAEIPSERQWIEDVAMRQLSHHENVALLQARRNGRTSIAELRQILQIDSEDLKILVQRLISQQLLYDMGNGFYTLPDGSPLLSPAEQEVYDRLEKETGIGIRELAERTGRTVNSLRPVLRRAINKGWIEAIGETTSRNRTYRKLI
ncbi:ATP-binding protein [Jonesiaceae bacterium BS-20]|uniref:ATP-binding protein n=1 Tax=Jonesiaceae bacterium BS-20 TaxID=3120821 RepID=A0AAU7DWU8_9MICO